MIFQNMRVDKKKHVRYKISNFFVLRKIITRLCLTCFLAMLMRLLILFALLFLGVMIIFSKMAIDNYENYV